MRRFLLVFIVALGGCTGRKAPAQTTRPVDEIRQVVVISVDGMRPDVMLRADAPNLRSLMNRGSFTFWAWTTEVSITLPSHTSMLTGCIPEHHGILFNDDGPQPQVYPKVPTLFELAHRSGYSTALCASKSKFAALARPGSVDWLVLPPKGSMYPDRYVAEQAAKIIVDHAPQVLFVHLGGVDSAGHHIGWGTPQQLAAMHEADASIGIVLDALKKQGLLDSTFILVSADHGGSGRTHGRDDWRSRFIPWITAGPGIKAGYDLTLDRELKVHTEDTFATVCWLMNIAVPGAIDGHPVRQIVDERSSPSGQSSSQAPPSIPSAHGS
ncbi:MAG: alkaline phosphatase family protein [Phycisphaerales bacterium]|nr:alkaline phosphatase family protein [Phycisphaerales bacterium]